MSKLNRVLLVLVVVAAVGASGRVIDRPARADDKAALKAAPKDTDATRPCGTYDIKKLSDHFRVTVETRKLSTGHHEVAITTDGKQGDKDSRKPFPTERMRLAVLDGKGGTQLETPIHWTKGKGKFDDGKESRASLIVAPALAGRLVIMTPPERGSFSPPFHVVIVGFRSLAD